MQHFRKILVFVLALIFTFNCLPQSVEAAPTKVELTDEKKAELEEYFYIFAKEGERFEYDIDNITNYKDIALEFAIFYALHDEGRYSSPNNGLWGMNFVDENGYGMDFNFNVDFNNKDYWKVVEYVPSENVDAVLLRFFNLTSIQHHSFLEENEYGTYGILYQDGKYHFIWGEGVLEIDSNIIEFYDNGSGTFSVRIEMSDWSRTDIFNTLPDISYSIAVIQPYNDNGIDTYQLLYWKNNVELNEPIPILQPSNSNNNAVGGYSLNTWIFDSVSKTPTEIDYVLAQFGGNLTYLGVQQDERRAHHYKYGNVSFFLDGGSGDYPLPIGGTGYLEFQLGDLISGITTGIQKSEIDRLFGKIGYISEYEADAGRIYWTLGERIAYGYLWIEADSSIIPPTANVWIGWQ